ncbi:hypothetical protein [Ochrobactrum chromiisoli]|uniref:Uncharacterized protein n=1 Tax=Ochrobactrum chromiisoli TaxID=2993941 RepID=A0ABT3QM45_9HYPH|nr:hypothetical protein [Ochrobactrum chromiisoli]MCX2696671.1 hypothetical protein [Ochrobactrum chromiisoli]
MRKIFKVKDPGHFGDCVVGKFRTIDEAIKCAEQVLSEYRKGSYNDGEWSFDTDGIMVVQGKTVVARAVECNVIERPDDVDEEGYSPSEDLWFNSVERYCDYKIERVSTRPTGGNDA